MLKRTAKTVRLKVKLAKNKEFNRKFQFLLCLIEPPDPLIIIIETDNEYRLNNIRNIIARIDGQGQRYERNTPFYYIGIAR